MRKELAVINLILLEIPIFVVLLYFAFSNSIVIPYVVLAIVCLLVIPSAILFKRKHFNTTIFHFMIFIILSICVYVGIKELYFLSEGSIQAYTIYSVVLSFPTLFMIRSNLLGWQAIAEKIISQKINKSQRFAPARQFSVGLEVSWLFLWFFLGMFCYSIQINNFDIFKKHIVSVFNYAELTPLIMSISAFLLILIILFVSFLKDFFKLRKVIKKINQ